MLVAFDSLPSLVSYIDRDLIYRYVNQAYAKWFEVVPQDCVGKPAIEILGAKALDQVKVELERAFQGTPQHFKTQMPYKLNGTRYVECNYIPHRDASGRVMGIYVITNDLTPEFEKKQFILGILNKMHEGVLIRDLTNRVIYSNDSALKLLGLTLEQLNFKTPLNAGWSLLNEEGNPTSLEHWTNLFSLPADLSSKNYTFGIRYPEGHCKWFQGSSTHLAGEISNRPASSMNTFTDITSHHERSQLITNIVRNSPGMIYQLELSNDGRTHFPFVSQKVFEIYELTLQEIANAPNLMMTAVHADDQNELFLKIKKSAETLEPFHWRCRIVTKSGKIKWIDAKSVPQRTPSGSTLWDGVVVDVTSEVKAQEELAIERSRAVVRSRLASLGEMSAGVAHEINNPLTIISGNVALLAGATHDPQKQLTRINNINQSVERISKIINGLKRFAQIDGTGIRRQAPLNEILNEAMTFAEIKAKKHFTRLRFETHTEAWIECNAVEIEQAIISIMNNGIEAAETQADKWVDVKLFEEGPQVVIQVTDSGLGIPAGIIDKIFDPFFTTKNVGEGTGLGLSIAQGIIKDHGGNLIATTLGGR